MIREEHRQRVRQHERDWLKLAVLLAGLGICVGFWVGLFIGLGVL